MAATIGAPTGAARTWCTIATFTYPIQITSRRAIQAIGRDIRLTRAIGLDTRRRGLGPDIQVIQATRRIGPDTLAMRRSRLDIPPARALVIRPAISRPAPYAGNRANLAATNPNRVANVPKTGTYPNRPAMSGKPGVAAGNFATARPIAKPNNNLNGGNFGRGGANPGAINGSVAGSSAPGASGQAPGQRHRHRHGGTGGATGTNPGASGAGGGMGTTGVRRARPNGG